MFVQADDEEEEKFPGMRRAGRVAGKAWKKEHGIQGKIKAMTPEQKVSPRGLRQRHDPVRLYASTCYFSRPSPTPDTASVDHRHASSVPSALLMLASFLCAVQKEIRKIKRQARIAFRRAHKA